MARGTGFPSGGMTLGTPTSMMQYGGQQSMGPLWQHQMRLPYVGQAYGIAQQMLGPGFSGMEAPTPWGNMLQRMIEPRAMSEHPGMSTAEWTQGMQGISAASEAEKAKAMGILGSTGGGTVDPRAAAAAMSRIGAGVPQAVSNLAARRSQLDLQAIMGMGGLQQPLARQELVNQGQMQQQYGQELRGLAGNILGSGVYGGGYSQQIPSRYSGGGGGGRMFSAIAGAR